MKVIGITGSIATGKSTVSNYIKQKGYVVIDADKIAYALLEVDGLGYPLIVEHFSDVVLNADKTLNRKKISEIIFEDENKRQLINQLIHPLVYQCIEQELLKWQSQSLVFIDVPLLFEAHFETLCDHVICVYTPQTIQLNRLIENRGHSLHDARLRIAAQMSIDEKRSKADIVIDNDDTLAVLHERIDIVLEHLERESKYETTFN